MSFEYHTEGTCARNIILEMDGASSKMYSSSADATEI